MPRLPRRSLTGKRTLIHLASTRMLRKTRSKRRSRCKMILDRKSTRLNSSHSQISYAVFCLKKKKKRTNRSNLAQDNNICQRDRARVQHHQPSVNRLRKLHHMTLLADADSIALE